MSSVCRRVPGTLSKWHLVHHSSRSDVPYQISGRTYDGLKSCHLIRQVDAKKIFPLLRHQPLQVDLQVEGCLFSQVGSGCSTSCPIKNTVKCCIVYSLHIGNSPNQMNHPSSHHAKNGPRPSSPFTPHHLHASALLKIGNSRGRLKTAPMCLSATTKETTRTEISWIFLHAKFTPQIFQERLASQVSHGMTSQALSPHTKNYVERFGSIDLLRCAGKNREGFGSGNQR